MNPDIKVRVEFDAGKLAKKIDKASEKALTAMTNEALKDANKYARMDTGETIRSSIRASEPEKGRLVWDTPYAKKAYYQGRPSTQTNPDARLAWAHFSFGKNRKKYERMLKQMSKEGF